MRTLVPALALLASLAGASPGQGAVQADGPGVVQEPPVARADPVPDTLDGRAYQSLRGRRATVHFARGDAALAERVRSLLDAQAPLPAIPDSLPANVHAVLAHSPAALDEVIGAVTPEWRAGVAVPALNLLAIPTGEGSGVLDGEGLRTLRHEWAHLGLSAYLDGLRVPRWFSEGYAEWASGGFDAMGAWRLRVGLVLGGTPSMDSVTLDWPRGREQARTAYLLAASAVTYLLESGGERGMALLLERWRTGRSFESALRETYGVTSGQLEEDWREHVKSRYGWLFVLSHSSVFWLALTLVLLYMVRVRRKRNQEVLARLRADELPDAPAFWNEDPDLGTDAPGSAPPREGEVDPTDRLGG